MADGGRWNNRVPGLQTPRAPRSLQPGAAGETQPILRGCFCLCYLITPLGSNEAGPHGLLSSPRSSICRSSRFFQALCGDTPSPLDADCKIRKLLPSWGNNRLPQCFSAQPAAAAKVETHQRVTFFPCGLFLWARRPPTDPMYFLCKTAEEVTF